MTRKFVGQSYDHDVAVCSCEQGLEPPAERCILLGETRKSRARAMDEQHPQYPLPRLPMRRSLGLPPVVAWRCTKSNQAAKVAPTIERLSIA